MVSRKKETNYRRGYTGRRTHSLFGGDCARRIAKQGPAVQELHPARNRSHDPRPRFRPSPMTRSNSHHATIVCFGEALWDILPRGIFLGGAPLNVAYHLSRHGVRALPVSAVGRDFLGDEALRRIAT